MKSTFSVLLKHELSDAFSLKKKKGSADLIGALLSLLITLAMAGVVIVLVATILDSYVTIRIDKISDPIGRSLEILNLLYSVVIIALSCMCLERMRASLSNPADREIFLRLPVKRGTIFLAKLLTLMLSNYITALFMVIPVNVIFYMVLKLDPVFWLYTLAVWALLPLVSFLISAVFIVPYIMIVNFLKKRYIPLFVLLSLALVGAFMLYSQLLAVVRGLFETGTIKFLFNAEFVGFLSGLTEWTYPAISFATIVLGIADSTAWLTVIAVAALSLPVTYLIANRLYYVTLYKNTGGSGRVRRPRMKKQKKQFSALMRKELISVFREPKHMFSYFAISAAMPVMVYSCYTLFETLILNALGHRAPFSLALITVLMFNILTNTFCSTNITRDGEAILKMKTLPVKASRIMRSKVAFCSAVAVISLAVSAVLLVLTTSLTITDGLICFAISLVFAISQILVATRLDLNGASVTATNSEIEKQSNKTIAKTVSIGLLLCLLVGMTSMLISLALSGESSVVMFGVTVRAVYSYLIPIAVCLLYLIFSMCFYAHKLENKFEELVR